MHMKEKNQLIVAKIREELVQRGLSDKMDVYPVENTCTRRPRYWNDGNTNRFKVHMWDLNKLEGAELDAAIAERIEQAAAYFKC